MVRESGHRLRQTRLRRTNPRSQRLHARLVKPDNAFRIAIHATHEDIVWINGERRAALPTIGRFTGFGWRDRGKATPTFAAPLTRRFRMATFAANACNGTSESHTQTPT